MLPNCTYGVGGHWAVVAPTHPLNDEDGDHNVGLLCHQKGDVLTLETNMVTVRFNLDQLSTLQITVKGTY